MTRISIADIRRNTESLSTDQVKQQLAKAERDLPLAEAMKSDSVAYHKWVITKSREVLKDRGFGQHAMTDERAKLLLELMEEYGRVLHEGGSNLDEMTAGEVVDDIRTSLGMPLG